jgi:hypothetical protein
MSHRTAFPSEPGAAAGQVKTTRAGGRIRVLETWFDEDPESLQGCDLWLSHQRSRPVSSRRWLYFYSPFVDLSQPPESLLAGMRKNVAREIRHAQERDDLSFAINTSPTEEDLETFASFYDANPHTPGQQPIDRMRLREFSRAGLVHLSTVHNPELEAMTWHCLLCHERSRIVQVLAMATPYHGVADKSWAAALGRANRWLFHQEFLFYRERGFATYDLNGWYAGVEDEKRLQINRFKEGFRGRIQFGFDCEEPVTLKGWGYLAYRALRRLFQPELARDRRRRKQKAPRLPE